MIIHSHILAYNEEKILPFTLDYYSNICDKIFIHDNMSTDSSDEIYKKYPKVTVLKWNSNNQIDENNYLKIKNEEYKKYSRDADWVIVCDCDEFLYHESLLNKLKEYYDKGVTIPYVVGYEMISETFPNYDGELITEKIKIGYGEAPELSKHVVFNPKIDIRYSTGAHSASSNNTIHSK